MTMHGVQATAGRLATREIEALEPSRTVESAHDFLTTNGFDTAPVVDGTTPTGFVRVEDLKEAPDGTPVSEYAHDITLDRVIAPDANFHEALDALVDEPFYYLGDRNQVTGILTRADVNTAPAYIHLFDMISSLEKAFRGLIKERVPDWKTHENVSLSRDERKNIERLYAEAKSKNVEMDEINYAQFSTLTDIVASVPECWQECGFQRQGQAERELQGVAQLRNAVAHSNLLVEQTDSGLSNARTVAAVLNRYDTIRSCLDELSRAGSESE